ncbi:hypothetical protein CPB84DRAFT_971170 [Gymnopilus junonius]|uniref:Secreted protein n=1 Tax=Gymnopilus junonius TaxID=109634 RepID=A0A9P5NRD9_GYMJU|nr:hypothetical protein CPB84DRAFT_971170 [Gymnopilus junonius]
MILLMVLIHLRCCAVIWTFHMRLVSVFLNLAEVPSITGGSSPTFTYHAGCNSNLGPTNLASMQSTASATSAAQRFCCFHQN